MRARARPALEQRRLPTVAESDRPRGILGSRRRPARHHRVPGCDGMHVLAGSGVGELAATSTFTSARRRASSTTPAGPPAITLATLAPYYDAACDMLDAQSLVAPAGRQLPSRTLVFQDACRKVGREPELVKIAVHTRQARRNPHGAAGKLPCDYSGNCAIGCAAQAKNSLDITYLALAERHGTEVYPLHQAELYVKDARRSDSERLRSSGSTAGGAAASRLPGSSSRRARSAATSCCCAAATSTARCRT